MRDAVDAQYKALQNAQTQLDEAKSLMQAKRAAFDRAKRQLADARGSEKNALAALGQHIPPLHQRLQRAMGKDAPIGPLMDVVCTFLNGLFRPKSTFVCS